MTVRQWKTEELIEQNLNLVEWRRMLRNKNELGKGFVKGDGCGPCPGDEPHNAFLQWKSVPLLWNQGGLFLVWGVRTDKGIEGTICSGDFISTYFILFYFTISFRACCTLLLKIGIREVEEEEVEDSYLKIINSLQIWLYINNNLVYDKCTISEMEQLIPVSFCLWI